MKQIEIKTEDIKTITENVNEVINIINSIEFIITPDELKTILSINNDNVWCGGVNSFIIEEIKERLTTEYINDKMGLIPEDVTDELYNIRSEERRVGNECTTLCRSGGSPCH